MSDESQTETTSGKDVLIAFRLKMSSTTDVSILSAIDSIARESQRSRSEIVRDVLAIHVASRGQDFVEEGSIKTPEETALRAEVKSLKAQLLARDVEAPAPTSVSIDREMLQAIVVEVMKEAAQTISPTPTQGQAAPVADSTERLVKAVADLSSNHLRLLDPTQASLPHIAELVKNTCKKKSQIEVSAIRALYTTSAADVLVKGLQIDYDDLEVLVQKVIAKALAPPQIT